MRVYHYLFFATRIQINVSWSGTGSGPGQMIRIQPETETLHLTEQYNNAYICLGEENHCFWVLKDTTFLSLSGWRIGSTTPTESGSGTGSLFETYTMFRRCMRHLEKQLSFQITCMPGSGMETVNWQKWNTGYVCFCVTVDLPGNLSCP